jgi:ribonucleoside-triphosphate reductase
MDEFKSNVIKRNGQEELFKSSKIRNAISKANDAIDDLFKISDETIDKITENVVDKIKNCNRQFNVEEIQDLVEKEISSYSWELAKAFTIYRFTHALQRDGDTVALNAELASKYKALMERAWNIYECTSEDIQQENANKNAYLLSTQADYAACELDKELLDYKEIFSKDVLEANAEKIIKIHDMGYSGRRMINCSLINLDDIFKNGTVINGVFIETPKSFDVACTVATQIESHIASGQYGGQTVNLWHIAQFVKPTREKFIKRTRKRYEDAGITYTEEQLLDDVEIQLKQHIDDGIQLLQYQVLTHMTTNG